MAPEIASSVAGMPKKGEPGNRRGDLDPVTRARISAWLRYYRDTREWTHERLAKELGLAEPTVTAYMNETRTPGLDTLIRMHRQLHRSADDLLDVDPPKAK